MDCREAISWVGGDLGKLAGATGQSSPRKARWSMEWKMASRRRRVGRGIAGGGSRVEWTRTV